MTGKIVAVFSGSLLERNPFLWTGVRNSREAGELKRLAELSEDYDPQHHFCTKHAEYDRCTGTWHNRDARTCTKCNKGGEQGTLTLARETATKQKKGEPEMAVQKTVAKATETEEKTQGSAKTSPHFTVKVKGQDGYAGSAWLNQWKYGKYITVRVNSDVPSGSTLYITPRKANPDIIG